MSNLKEEGKGNERIEFEGSKGESGHITRIDQRGSTQLNTSLQNIIISKSPRRGPHAEIGGSSGSLGPPRARVLRRNQSQMHLPLSMLNADTAQKDSHNSSFTKKYEGGRGSKDLSLSALNSQSAINSPAVSPSNSRRPGVSQSPEKGSLRPTEETSSRKLTPAERRIRFSMSKGKSHRSQFFHMMGESTTKSQHVEAADVAVPPMMHPTAQLRRGLQKANSTRMLVAGLGDSQKLENSNSPPKIECADLPIPPCMHPMPQLRRGIQRAASTWDVMAGATTPIASPSASPRHNKSIVSPAVRRELKKSISSGDLIQLGACHSADLASAGKIVDNSPHAHGEDTMRFREEYRIKETHPQHPVPTEEEGETYRNSYIYNPPEKKRTFWEKVKRAWHSKSKKKRVKSVEIVEETGDIPPTRRPFDVKLMWKKARSVFLTLVRWKRVQKEIQLYGTQTENVERMLQLHQSKLKGEEEQQLILTDIQKSKFPWGMVHPHSMFKKTWTIIIFFLMMYSVIIMPYRICFYDQDIFWWKILEYAIDFGFMLDVIINSLSAYFENEILIKERRQILCKYAKSWMALDIIACLPFELIFEFSGLENESTSQASDYNSLLRLLRLPRLYRMFRITRLLKILKVTNEENFIGFQDMITMHYRVVRAILFVFFSFIFSHLFACLWFWIARIQNFSYDCWAVKTGIQDLPPEKQYLWSIYWALQVLTTVGFGDVVAYTNSERVVCILWMIVGAFLFAYFIGLISIVLSTIDTKKSKLILKLTKITDFCREANIDWDLKMKMKSAVMHNAEQEGFSWIETNQIYEEFPPKLKYEIAISMHNGIISTIPFFASKDTTFITQMVQFLKPLKLNNREYIYRKNDHPYEIYFICKGQVDFLVDMTDFVFKSYVSRSYFGEIEIIFKRKRLFSTRVRGIGDFLTLNKKYYKDLLKYEFPEIAEEMRTLAQERTVNNMDALKQAYKVLGEESLGMTAKRGGAFLPQKNIKRFQDTKTYEYAIKKLSKKRHSLKARGGIIDFVQDIQKFSPDPGKTIRMGGKFQTVNKASEALKKVDPNEVEYEESDEVSRTSKSNSSHRRWGEDEESDYSRISHSMGKSSGEEVRTNRHKDGAWQRVRRNEEGDMNNISNNISNNNISNINISPRSVISMSTRSPSNRRKPQKLQTANTITNISGISQSAGNLDLKKNRISSGPLPSQSQKIERHQIETKEKLPRAERRSQMRKNLLQGEGRGLLHQKTTPWEKKVEKEGNMSDPGYNKYPRQGLPRTSIPLQPHSLSLQPDLGNLGEVVGNVGHTVVPASVERGESSSEYMRMEIDIHNLTLEGSVGDISVDIGGNVERERKLNEDVNLLKKGIEEKISESESMENTLGFITRQLGMLCERIESITSHTGSGGRDPHNKYESYNYSTTLKSGTTLLADNKGWRGANTMNNINTITNRNSMNNLNSINSMNTINSINEGVFEWSMSEGEEEKETKYVRKKEKGHRKREYNIRGGIGINQSRGGNIYKSIFPLSFLAHPPGYPPPDDDLSSIHDE